jgi:hypothetical protein
MLSLLLAGLTLPYGPGRVPERVLYNMAADPARSAVITWRTAEPGPASGEIAPASPDPRFVRQARQVQGSSQAVTLADGRVVHYHIARFEGLEPGGHYSYRVGSADGWSEWFDFRTAHDAPRPFTFAYFGDAQNDLKSLWSRVVRKAFRAKPDLAFMLHAGDLIDDDAADQEWADWFYAGGWAHGQVPSVAVPGNHEYVPQPTGPRTLTPYWRPQFAMPENGPAGLERTCFWFDYQGARFVGLDSNVRVQDQAAWLDRVLSENPHKWAFVTFHHPVYSTAFGRDNKEVREAWQPILEKHKVAIVMQGHDHTYGRQNVPTGEVVRTRGGAPVYVVSVSGPKMYRLGPETAKTMPRRAEYTQLFQLIRVDGDLVVYEAYTSTGDLYDAFELRRRRDGAISFRERKSPGPERIEPTPATGRRDG